jgi:acetate kinase
MRDLLQAARRGSERARTAIDIFVYRIKKYIGAYQAVMNGLDAVVFTAGIGENNPWLVKRLKTQLRNVVGKKAKFLVIPTDEELLIAEDTYRIVNSIAKSVVSR